MKTTTTPQRKKSAAIVRFISATLITASLAISILAQQPGSLDLTFSGDGKLRDWESNATGVVIQPNGKIVVIGTGPWASPDFRIARYNADGTPDTSFGNGTGRVSSDFGLRDPGSSVILQPDGKIIVAGPGYFGGVSAFGLARYNPDGSPDTQFGSNGFSMIRTPENCIDYSYGESAEIALQPDGKIVGVIGYEDWDWNCKWAGLMFRFDQHGLPDASFGEEGIVHSGGDWGAGALWSVAIQPSDGKIVASGYRFIKRFNSDGSADISFGDGGEVSIPYPSFLVTVATQRDGKILAAGSSGTPQYDFAIYRFNANGTPDTSFGIGGLAQLGIGNYREWATSIAIQRDAKIVVAGTVLWNEQAADFAVARLNPNGSRDATFGCAGLVCVQGVSVFDFNNSSDFVSHMALDRAGRAVVVGGSGDQFGIARLLSGLRAPSAFDFDGDGRADAAVRRAADNTWYIRQPNGGFTGRTFGAAGDVMAPADYDGDGKTDIAVFRPSEGVFYIQGSQVGFYSVGWGQSGDLPVPADYDGDGKADVAVFRPSNGTWYRKLSNGNVLSYVNFGVSGDRPQLGDFDGDGRTDIAVFRPSDNNWYLLQTTAGFTIRTFGAAGDIPLAADYDGDARTDIAVWRPSTGTWYVSGSQVGYYFRGWGLSTDTPVPADYDGDGKADLGIFRPSESNWYVLGVGQFTFGSAGDAPVESAFVY